MAGKKAGPKECCSTARPSCGQQHRMERHVIAMQRTELPVADAFARRCPRGGNSETFIKRIFQIYGERRPSPVATCLMCVLDERRHSPVATCLMCVLQYTSSMWHSVHTSSMWQQESGVAHRRFVCTSILVELVERLVISVQCGFEPQRLASHNTLFRLPGPVAKACGGC